MDPLLDDLIERFRNAQDSAVAFIVDVAKLPWPNSNREWWQLTHKLPTEVSVQGVVLSRHGYGIGVAADDFNIDFDWGDDGEPDGFDGWRLYYFCLENCPQLECTHDQLNRLLESATMDGSLIKAGSLYYDPRRRASRRRPH